MATEGWATIRIRAERKAQIQARLAGGDSVSAFVDRTLAAALSEATGTCRQEQASPGPVGSPEPVRLAAPRRAPVPVDPALARQAKLNDAKYGGGAKRGR